MVRHIQPDSAFADGSHWVRGMRPLVWVYTVRSPEAKALAELDKEFANPRPGRPLIKQLGDRTESCSAVFGRRVTHAASTGRIHSEFADLGSYTTLRISEAPNLAGRPPRSWPKLAVCPRPPWPLHTPKLRCFHGFTLVSMASDMTPAGSSQVWAGWVAPGPAANVSRQIENETRGGTAWRKNGTRFWPQDKSSGFEYLEVEPLGRMMPSIGDKMSLIGVSYVLPIEHYP